MQVKKEELRFTIIEIAEEQFLKRGYENASMRLIAKKANTTLGNIYHYFPNKETLLKTILIPTIETIEMKLAEHILKEQAGPFTRSQIFEYMSDFENNFERSEWACFLDRKLIILLELKTSDLLARKDKVIQILIAHLNWHFNIKDEDTHYSEIALNMLIECIKHVLIEHSNLQMAKTEFIKFTKLFCSGMTGQLLERE